MRPPVEIAVYKDPQMAALADLGFDLYNRLMWPEAETVLRYVHGHERRNVRVLNLLALIRNTLNDLEDGEFFGRQCVELCPDIGPYRSNLAHNLMDQGRFAEAEAEFLETLQSQPDRNSAVAGLGNLYLRTGRYDEGWPLYLRFPKAERYTELRENVPDWQGQSLTSKAILVLDEQGLGDEIMAARLYEQLASLGGEVSVVCDPRLVPLMERSLADVSFLANDDEAAIVRASRRADYSCYLTKLVSQLAPNLRPKTQAWGYIKPDAERSLQLGNKYNAIFGNKRRIGISWATSSKYKPSARTIPLQLWDAVLKIPDCQFFNLQYSADLQGLDEAAGQLGVSIFTDPEIDARNDIDGLAAQISVLDQVISIDNTTVHLAAALGKPVWTLLTEFPHWIWGLEGKRSAWYPSVRLFRQSQRGSWTSVLEEVASAMAADVEDVQSTEPEMAELA